MNLKVGDLVQAKDHVRDMDIPTCSMAGWEGKVTIVDEKVTPRMLEIKWSKQTLAKMPKELIEYAEEEAVDIRHYYLAEDDVIIIPRLSGDSDDFNPIEFFDYGTSPEQNRRISKVISEIDPEDKDAILSAWNTHLLKNLEFPFAAIVTDDHEDDGEISSGDKVRVLRINEVDDLMGVMVEIEHELGTYVFPLCNLEAVDRKSRQYTEVKDYVVWDANK